MNGCFGSLICLCFLRLLLSFSAVSSVLVMIISCIVNFILLHYAFHCIVYALYCRCMLFYILYVCTVFLNCGKICAIVTDSLKATYLLTFTDHFCCLNGLDQIYFSSSSA